jgi:hypothetical protein
VREQKEQENAGVYDMRMNRFDTLKFAVGQIETMTCELRAKYFDGSTGDSGRGKKFCYR